MFFRASALHFALLRMVRCWKGGMAYGIWCSYIGIIWYTAQRLRGWAALRVHTRFRPDTVSDSVEYVPVVRISATPGKARIRARAKSHPAIPGPQHPRVPTGCEACTCVLPFLNLSTCAEFFADHSAN